MVVNFLKSIIDLAEDFELKAANSSYPMSREGFMKWIADNSSEIKTELPDWQGKEDGRTPESIINTLLVHLNRYAKSYSKSAIFGSEFSTQDEFIYLINLKAHGSMSKMQLIQLNVHDKPAGMQIISRLINQGWIGQADSQTDRRSKIIFITQEGIAALEKQMKNIRKATNVVAGNLTENEKYQLIRLLQKLDHFHKPIYQQNLTADDLLEKAYENYLQYVN